MISYLISSYLYKSFEYVIDCCQSIYGFQINHTYHISSLLYFLYNTWRIFVHLLHSSQHAYDCPNAKSATLKNQRPHKISSMHDQVRSQKIDSTVCPFPSIVVMPWSLKLESQQNSRLQQCSTSLYKTSNVRQCHHLPMPHPTPVLLMPWRYWRAPSWHLTGSDHPPRVRITIYLPREPKPKIWPKSSIDGL